MNTNDPALAGVRVGDVLDGRYVVEGILGVGGMGVVVSARHLKLDEVVAIKFLRPEASMDGEAVVRFSREARAAVKIKSEHVARVIDIATLPNGAPYMVMEFLRGRDLGALVRESGPLPVCDAVDCILEACEAVAEAHQLGIIHRDLKPANLFVAWRPDGTPLIKVLDFGISKISDGSGAMASMTRTSAIMGSPLYMSPEQMASSRDVDGRTDIWALGVILHEILSGKVPFEGVTLPELCLTVLHTPAPPLRALRPEVPQAVEAAVLRCLEKDRGRRFASIVELASALAPCGSARSTLSYDRIVRLGGGATARLSTTPGAVRGSGTPARSTDAVWGNTASAERRQSRRGPLALGFAALGAVVVAVPVVAVVLRVWSSSPPVIAPSAGASEPTQTTSAGALLEAGSRATATPSTHLDERDAGLAMATLLEDAAPRGQATETGEAPNPNGSAPRTAASVGRAVPTGRPVGRKPTHATEVWEDERK